MTGISLCKSDVGPSGYTPPKTWNSKDMNAPQLDLYRKIQQYNRIKGRHYDREVLIDVSEVPSSEGTGTGVPGQQGNGRQPSQAKQLRNEIAAVIITQSAHLQQGMQEDVYEVVGELNIFFDAVGLTLNGLGVVVGAAEAKTAFAAAAGGALGFRNSATKSFLAEQTQFAILTEMEALWTDGLARIQARLQSEKPEDEDERYSLQDVGQDIYRLYSSGWLRDAVATLAKRAQEDKTTALNKLQPMSGEKQQSSSTAKQESQGTTEAPAGSKK
jgi:hypothetical protein